MLRSICLGLTLTLGGIGTVPAPVAAQSVVAPQVGSQAGQELIEILRIPDLIALISQEGINAAPGVERDMFPGRGGAGWLLEVERLYDVDVLLEQVLGAWPGAMTPEDIEVLTAFYGSPLGQRFIDAEVDTRAAMLDPSVDDAAMEAGQILRQEGGARADLLAEFIEAYDLLSQNVVGALNSNLAFFVGLEAGGGLPQEMTESAMLRQVYSQEPEIRAEMEEWLYGYLAASYAGFTDAEIETYIAFARTTSAQRFNQVIFEGFNVLFETVSRDLGRAVAGYIVAEDI